LVVCILLHVLGHVQGFSLTQLLLLLYYTIYIYKNGCLCVCAGITLERLERFRPNLVNTLLYVCVIYIPGHNSGTPRAISTKLGTHIAVCMLYIFPGITLERLERFRPNLVHTLLYICVKILCIYFIYIYIYIPQGGWCGRQGIWMIHIVEEIKL
jgi:hypothetical protein